MHCLPSSPVQKAGHEVKRSWIKMLALALHKEIWDCLDTEWCLGRVSEEVHDPKLIATEWGYEDYSSLVLANLVEDLWEDRRGVAEATTPGQEKHVALWVLPHRFP